METDPNTIVYRVNGFDSIEVKVNPKTMEIEAGKSELEEHIGQKDLDVSELISDGVLYQHHDSELNHGMFHRVEEYHKKSFQTFDKVFYVYLNRKLQIYARNMIPLMAFCRQTKTGQNSAAIWAI